MLPISLPLSTWPSLEQSDLIAKQRAKNDTYATFNSLSSQQTNKYNNNNNNNSNVIATTKYKRKGKTITTTTKSHSTPVTPKQQQQQQHEQHEQLEQLEQVEQPQQQIVSIVGSSKFENFSCQNAYAYTHTQHAYAQPYATPTYMHTNTLSTFKSYNNNNKNNNKNNNGVSHYFNSLDNRSQRHQYQHQHHHHQHQHQHRHHQQQPQQFEQLQYRRTHSKQLTYDSLTPYSVAHLSSASLSSEDTATIGSCQNIDIKTKQTTKNNHTSFKQQQQQQQAKQSRDNHCHYISLDQSKSILQQYDKTATRTTSLKHNKRNKLHSNLQNPMQEQT